MEDLCSVSSPRRILSLSKRRRASDEKAPGFGLSGDHGPKPSEVYGFVGSISTVVATGHFFFFFFLYLTLIIDSVYSLSLKIFLFLVYGIVIYLIWAYLPDSCLHSIGIYYYPSRSVLQISGFFCFVLFDGGECNKIRQWMLRAGTGLWLCQFL